MGAKVEVIFNPTYPVPPRKKLIFGSSYLLQTGDTDYKVVISDEFLGQELIGYIYDLEKVIAAPETLPQVVVLASKCRDLLKQSLKKETIEETKDDLLRARIKHEYHHLEQSLTVFYDENGRHISIDHISDHRKAYGLGDKNRLLNKEVISQFDYCFEYFRTLGELDAIIAEFQLDSRREGLVSRNAILIRTAFVISYLRRYDDLICNGFPHLKAMIVMLTGQMELADKDEHNQIDYEAIITDLVDSLDTALEDPQAFLDAVRVYLAPQVHHALRNAFLMLNSAYGNFMNDALDKKIIPDWGS